MANLKKSIFFVSFCLFLGLFNSCEEACVTCVGMNPELLNADGDALSEVVEDLYPGLELCDATSTEESQFEGLCVAAGGTIE